ncbi:MAG TPA: hemerythrin domain-containing protein [Pyrinomonadaceae bacterium]|nr:hemerythrin domain-containing protein [Pyrinomonadaceae bacterium]
MNDSVLTLLQEDHASLGHLLVELDGELLKANLSRAFELLDLFWARLAIHIRGENLHLFPALAAISVNQSDNDLPTSQEIKDVLTMLRSDHNFFMKELARAIQDMRTMMGQNSARKEELEDLRRQLQVLKRRLDRHNHLEEERVYVWPSLLFDDQALANLADQLQHELHNLPQRFS